MKGLGGFDLGHHLIMRVVRQLQSELPNVNVYSTLSPVPGFRKWLTYALSLATQFSKDRKFQGIDI